jgi:hypothetical protein
MLYFITIDDAGGASPIDLGRVGSVFLTAMGFMVFWRGNVLASWSASAFALAGGVAALLVGMFGPAFAANSPAPARGGVREVYVRGTRTKESNVTEPKPKEGKVFKTLHAGFAIHGKKAAYYWRGQITTPGNYYVRIEYENPADKERPLVNDMELPERAVDVEFSSPDFVRGIRIYGDYKMKATFYGGRDMKVVIDKVEQTVRSYVDTTKEEVRVFKGLK